MQDFREHVLDLLRQHYPERIIERGADDLELISGSSRLYLADLFDLTLTMTTSEREAEIVKWSSIIAKGIWAGHDEGDQLLEQ